MDDIIRIEHIVEVKNNDLESAIKNLVGAVDKLNNGIHNVSKKTSTDGDKQSGTTIDQKQIATTMKGLADNLKLNTSRGSEYTKSLQRNSQLVEANTKAIMGSKVSAQDITDRTNAKNNADIAKAKELSKIQLDTFNNMSATRVQEAKKLSENRLETKNAKNKMDDDRSWEKLGKGLMLGGALSIAYQMGNWGAVAGKESGSINQSASNYLDFQQNLQNMKFQNQSNTGTMLSGLIGGIIGSRFGEKGAAFGSIAGAAVGGYFSNKLSEEGKSQYKLSTDEDYASWQLQKMGLSGKSKTSLKSPTNILNTDTETFNISTLQEEAKKQGAYGTDVLNIAKNSRRDVTFGGKSDSDIVKFAVNTQKTAMQMGVSPTSLGNIISQMSGTTGKSTDILLKEVSMNVAKYGGDGISNLSKIQQILQTTSMSDKGASNLVNTYQYNDAMIKNKIGANTNNITGSFKSWALGKISGMSDKEIEMMSNGVVPPRSQQQIFRGRRKAWKGDIDVMAIAAEMAVSAGGMNPNVRNLSGVKPIGLNNEAMKNAPDEAQSFMQYNKMVADQLKEITVNGNVTINSLSGTSPLATRQDEQNARNRIGLPDNGQSSKIEKDY